MKIFGKLAKLHFLNWKPLWFIPRGSTLNYSKSNLSSNILTFRNDNLVMKPIWRLQNGQGPSWKYAQAMVESETNYQVCIFLIEYLGSRNLGQCMWIINSTQQRSFYWDYGRKLMKTFQLILFSASKSINPHDGIFNFSILIFLYILLIQPTIIHL